jgi:hypothetical protein
MLGLHFPGFSSFRPLVFGAPPATDPIDNR